MSDQEHPCTSCGGSGQLTIPKMEMDNAGRPMVIQDVITCITCGGNGKVRY